MFVKRRAHAGAPQGAKDPQCACGMAPDHSIKPRQQAKQISGICAFWQAGQRRACLGWPFPALQ